MTSISLLDKLSEELLLLIFEYVNDASQLSCLALVCKTFHRIVSDDLLWRQLTIKTFPKSFDELYAQQSLDGYTLPPNFTGFRRFFARCYSSFHSYKIGRQRPTVLEGHSESVNCFQVLEINHSLHVVSGGKDGIVVDWNLGVSKESPCLIRSAPLIEKQPNNESIVAMAYDAPTKLLVIATHSKLQLLSMDNWELADQITQPQVKTLLIKRINNKPVVFFTQQSFEGTLIKMLTIGQYGTFGVVRTFGSHSVAVHSLDCIDDRWIVSGDIGGSLKIWSFQGVCLCSERHFTFGAIRSIAQFDQTLMLGHYSGHISVFRIPELRNPRADPIFGRQKRRINNIINNNNNNNNNVNMNDDKMQLDEKESQLELEKDMDDVGGFQLVQTLHNHTGLVSCIQLHRDRMVSGSADRSIVVWQSKSNNSNSTFINTTPNDWTPKLRLQHSGIVNCIYFDDTKVVSGSGDCSVRVWDIQTGACWFVWDRYMNVVHAIQVRDHLLFSCCADGTLVVSNFLRPKRSLVGDLPFSKIDNRLKMIQKIQIEKQQQLQQLQQLNENTTTTTTTSTTTPTTTTPLSSPTQSRHQQDPNDIYVLVLPGSFSPPHRGHLRLLESARAWVEEHFGCTVAFGILSPYHDDYGAQGLAPSDRRVEMCELITNESDWLFVSRWEVSQEAPPFEVQTVRHVREALEQHYLNYNNNNNNNNMKFHLVNVLGSTERQPRINIDDYSEMLTVADVLFMSFHKHQTQTDDLPVVDTHQVWLAQSKELFEDINSKIVRGTIFNEKPIEELVGSRVSRYISDHKLYA